jgi:hypothetical protein
MPFLHCVVLQAQSADEKHGGEKDEGRRSQRPATGHGHGVNNKAES